MNEIMNNTIKIKFQFFNHNISQSVIITEQELYMIEYSQNDKIDEIDKIDEHINLDNILFETINDNSVIYFSAIILIISLIIEIIIFPSMYSNFVAKFPDKIFDIKYKDIIWLLLPYIFAELLFSLADTIDSYVFPKIENTVVEKLIKKIVLSTKKTKKEINSNDLMLNLKKISDVKEIYYLICAYVLPAIAVSAGVGYYFIKADKTYGIVMSLILVISFISLLIMGKSCSSNTKDNEEKTITFYDDVNDILNNIGNILSSGTELNEISRIKKNQKIIFKSNVKKGLCNTHLKFSFSVIYFFIMLVFNGSAIKLYHDGKITKSVLVTIFFMVSALISIYDSMAYEAGNITNVVGVYNAIKKYFNKFEISGDTDIVNINDDVNSDFVVKEGEIKFIDIFVKYNKNIIFNKLNLTIHPNSITCIVGKIGSGKSTLLKILTGLVKYQGIIKIDNFDISKYDSSEIAKYLAYIPQNPKLFNRTIYENLNYGSDYSEDQIWEKIKEFDVFELFNSFDKKLNTMVGKNGEGLSGGQRQLVYILRTLIQNKKIILFDEPTSSLDVTHRNFFMKLLLKIKNKTIVIVTHDDELLPISNKILSFSK